MRRFGASRARTSRRAPLTCGDSLPILGFPSTTKGGDPVSLPSAVTSLGSPAKLLGFANGRSRRLRTSEYKIGDAAGAIPPRLFVGFRLPGFRVQAEACYRTRARRGGACEASEGWWGRKDSNLRSHKTADLQSAPFATRDTPPLQPSRARRRNGGRQAMDDAETEGPDHGLPVGRVYGGSRPAKSTKAGRQYAAPRAQIAIIRNP